MGRSSGKSNKLNDKHPHKGSAFKKGKKLVIPGAIFDSRYLWYVKGFRPGVIVHWLQKPTRVEEAFARKFFDDFRASPELLDECGFDLILNMKGENGEDFCPQAANSTWPWRLLVACVGNDDNTEEVRMEQANEGIQLYNRTATKDNYKFPRQVRFCKDLTGAELEPLDTILLDKDVINLMQAAYPDMTLEQMLEDDDIMSDFWSNLERGAEAIRTHISTHLSQEEDNAAES